MHVCVELCACVHCVCVCALCVCVRTAAVSRHCTQPDYAAVQLLALKIDSNTIVLLLFQNHIEIIMTYGSRRLLINRI